jgi:lipopolysaccharide transport system permease protein
MRNVRECGGRFIRVYPRRGWHLDFGGIWRARELVRLLMFRDIQLRYQQTALGIVWVVLQPLLGMVIFATLFGRLAGLPSDGHPYALFVLCALIPWQLFAHALTEASRSVVASERLITKVYFPRAVIPIAATLSSVVDAVVSSSVVAAMMLWYRVGLTTAVLWLPVFAAAALTCAAGTGLWLAALNVRYRDVRYAVPFLTQILFFVTPVVYSSSLIPGRWRPWLALNPMAGVVEGFRWSLLGGSPSLGLFAISAFMAIALLMGGLAYFQRVERDFADVI